MYPDGGIARFRLFGVVVPVFPEDPSAIIDLAHVANGGLAVAFSDQHFGRASNLLLPGRGVDMGDGWETKRSRGGEHTDWVIVKLGTQGIIEKAIIDTAHFKGNFPQYAKLEATLSDEVRAPLLAANISLCLPPLGLRFWNHKSVDLIKSMNIPVNLRISMQLTLMCDLQLYQTVESRDSVSLANGFKYGI